MTLSRRELLKLALPAGEWRCDTHPRISPDQRWVCIDSPHGGKGRQMHLIDLRDIVAA